MSNSLNHVYCLVNGAGRPAGSGPAREPLRRGDRLRLDLVPGSAMRPAGVVVGHPDGRRVGVLGGAPAGDVAERLRDGDAYAFVSDVDEAAGTVALLVVLAGRADRSPEVNRYARRFLREGLEPLSGRAGAGHALRAYALAVACVGLALALTLLIVPPGGFGRASLFLAGVMVASWYGGSRPGLVAAILSAAAMDYVIMPPTFEVTLTWAALRELTLFLAAALTIGSLNEARLRRQRIERGRIRLFASAILDRTEVLRGLARPAASLEGVLMSLCQAAQDGAPAINAERHVCEIARMLNGFLLENGILPEGGFVRRDDVVLSGESSLT